MGVFDMKRLKGAGIDRHFGEYVLHGEIEIGASGEHAPRRGLKRIQRRLQRLGA